MTKSKPFLNPDKWEMAVALDFFTDEKIWTFESQSGRDLKIEVIQTGKEVAVLGHEYTDQEAREIGWQKLIDWEWERENGRKSLGTLRERADRVKPFAWQKKPRENPPDELVGAHGGEKEPAFDPFVAKQVDTESEIEKDLCTAVWNLHDSLLRVARVRGHQLKPLRNEMPARVTIAVARDLIPRLLRALEREVKGL